MTTHAESNAAHGTRQEEDRISTPRIVAVGIGSLVVFAIGCLVVGLFWQGRMAAATLPPVPPEAGTSKIGLVEQQIFDVANRGLRERATQLEYLGSYGWVDRRLGVAHIPIETAMQLVERGERARGGAAQQARPPEAQP